MAKSINDLMQDWQLLNTELSEIAEGLRLFILQTYPDVFEEVKYGGLLYSVTSPALKSVCGIFVYKQHVSLEFSFGAALKDSGKLLEGKGKFRRHLKFRSLQDLQDKPYQDYLEQAFNNA